ncbi:MAG: alpha-galactosidase, partial [Candidatus Latescibacterota bacterium]
PIGPVLIVGDVTCTPGSPEMPCTQIAIDPEGPCLSLTFACKNGLVAKHFLKPSPDKAVLVSWTTIQNPTEGSIAQIARFDALNMALQVSGEHPWAAYLLGWLWGTRADAPGRPAQPFAYPQSVTRLVHDDTAPPPPPGGWASSALRLIKEPLGILPLRSGKRSTYDNHPWCTVLDPRRGGGFFAGLQWTGTWELNLKYDLAAPAVSLQAASAADVHALEPGAFLTSPTAFVGLFSGDWDDGFNACRRYVRDEILPQVDHTFPLVQDNVGNPGLTSNKLDRIYREIDLAHQAGIELITIDAQWYPESSDFEFSYGLGLFSVDPVKFPDGLRPVSDYVHALGMKFGLWFEFSRVDLRTANRGRNPWSPNMLVHYNNYAYRSWCQHMYMMCTGAEGAADWALENMSWCVQEFGLDYVKIDDNDWAVCNDATHGHDAGDGEWAQIQGVYHILGGLRERYPHLMIENCASGSQRADLGMARYCLSIQMNDRHFPSILERRYSHGIGSIYPQFAPLLIFAGPYRDAEHLRWRAFSRMMGGFNCNLDGLSPELREEMKRLLATYKRIRATLHGDRYVLAEPAVVLEPDVPEATNWEVYEYHTPEEDMISVFCFRCNSPDDTFRAVLKGLDPEASYQLASHSEGELGVLSGAHLMREGMDCRLDERCRAQIYILTRQ